VLLAAIALSLSMLLGTAGPALISAQAAASGSQLPATQPGLSRYEGVFLVTAADDGSRLVYFIAQNTRHSTSLGDLQLEQQLNSLWPVRLASRDEVLVFPEAAPVGSARTGLLSGPVAAEVEEAPVDEVPMAAEAPALAEAPMVAETPIVASPPAAVPMPTAAEPSGDPAVRVLQRGDNLTRISAQYATTIEAILAANGLTNANRIFIGQTLLIPSVAAAPEEIVAAPLPENVASPTAATPEADVPASADGVTYTVRAGDSAIHIARQFGVDLDELLTANRVSNRNRVYVGQVLDIPGA
jgi:LysM repeat protein